MKNLGATLGAILLIGLAAFGWYRSGFDSAIQKDEAVKSSWAQVENQLQRRNDLIPNLVSTVKGFAALEKSILTEITKLRSQWGEAKTIPDKIENAEAVSSAISRLLLVAENYPQLKSDQNFLALQSQLEGTENRIAVERMRYNEAVRDFNAYRRTFFGRYFAVQANINEAAVYFQAEEKAKQVPQVSF